MSHTRRFAWFFALLSTAALSTIAPGQGASATGKERGASLAATHEDAAARRWSSQDLESPVGENGTKLR